MSYKICLLDALSPVEWSQAVWRLGGTAETPDCDRELIHDVLLEHLPKQGLIVDAGCGTAKWVTYLRRLGFPIMGIDLSHQAAVIARENDPGVDIMVADARKAPLRDHSVDAVLSLGVVEHDEAGPIAGLRELHRILKRNGLLVLEVPFNNALRRLIFNHLQTFVTWRRRRANMKLGFVEYRFSRHELSTFLQRTGFEVISVHPNDYLPPKNVGIWVDHQNLFFDPFTPPKPEEFFILPGFKGKLAAAATRWFPWLVAGGVAVVARAK